MDAKSIALLEFPVVRERLAAATGFPPGRRLAEALLPSPDPVLVAIASRETSQARALLAEHPSAGIGGARDIGPAVDRAARGGRLDAVQFAAIAQTIEAGSRLRDVLADDRRTLLHELARSLHPLPGLRSTLERSFDPAGELLDTASPRLGALRRATRVAYERLRARLEQLVHSSDVGAALQDPIITIRNGRYVVPVRADARSRVKGIVHDASGSGQTLFVEPLVAVELGNAWREAQLAEAAEIERILDELSALVGSQAGPLGETLDALARFDLWSAKARLAEEMDAVRAEPAARAEIVLKGARHPGLAGRVVPIDVELGTEFRALLVTGPNTGGKTVTLRTIGLLALMHQAGLHVPADPGSRLPVLADVFADIGDEQSVAQSLSTFSGHMRSIVRIAAAAGPATLVLLDELGAGTDPTEGSALAQALLDHFLRTGALVAATTHYAELKVYAHTTPDVRNASVEFDLETLSPTFHLRIGLPGGSQAFAIAERLGLPAPIVADARSRLSEGQQAFEETLASIRAADLATREALDRARAAEQRAAESQRAADEERRRARRERDETVTTARADAERIVEDLRAEVRGARRRLERETITAPALDEVVERAEARLGMLPAAAPAAVPVRQSAPVAWRVGARARSRSGGWEGRIVALERGGRRATLEVGGMRVTAPTAELDLPATSVGEAPRPARPGGGSSEEASGISRLRLERARTVASSLDVRGARVEEALEVVDRYLEDASLAGLDRATIIHGLGTGALRDAVRAAASAHPLVRSVRAGERGEGGDGATVVGL
jgi:DNA mismatch repair protein MutS2